MNANVSRLEVKENIVKFVTQTNLKQKRNNEYQNGRFKLINKRKTHFTENLNKIYLSDLMEVLPCLLISISNEFR